MNRYNQSAILLERAKQSLAGGVSSEFRKFNHPHALFYSNANGSRIYAEPAFTTKFLEIVCSPATDIKIAEYLYELASNWGEEPTMVRKDIRGFITNSIIYAIYRETFSLVENGYATIEDVDRTCRNDGGH